MMTLYELNEEYVEILESMELGGLNENEILKLAKKATLDDAEFGEFLTTKDAILKKVESYAKVLLDAQAKLTAVKEEVERLIERKKNLENNIKKLQKDIGESLNLLGIKKQEYSLFTVKTTASELLVVDSIENVPQEYKKKKVTLEFNGTEEIPESVKEKVAKVTEEVSKKELKKLCQDGVYVEGIHIERNVTAKVQ